MSKSNRLNPRNDKVEFVLVWTGQNWIVCVKYANSLVMIEDTFATLALDKAHCRTGKLSHHNIPSRLDQFVSVYIICFSSCFKTHSPGASIIIPFGIFRPVLAEKPTRSLVVSSSSCVGAPWPAILEWIPTAQLARKLNRNPCLVAFGTHLG
jgi:hypothetical protein